MGGGCGLKRDGQVDATAGLLRSLRLDRQTQRKHTANRELSHRPVLSFHAQYCPVGFLRGALRIPRLGRMRGFTKILRAQKK